MNVINPKMLRCGACGNDGHTRNSSSCPMYNAEEAKKKREEKAQEKERKKKEADVMQVRTDGKSPLRWSTHVRHAVVKPVGLRIKGR